MSSTPESWNAARDSDSTLDFLPETPPRTPRVFVDFGGLTDPGKVRSNNEDHFLIARLAKAMRICRTSLPGYESYRFGDEDAYLMVVADGMGGAAAGEHASALSIEAVQEFALNVFKWFLHCRGDDKKVLLHELRGALEEADHEVFRQARADRSLAGMGTTLTVGYSIGRNLYVAHVGDSRAYLLRGEELTQITTDHNLSQLLLDAGRLSPDDARLDPRRHIITNVVGGPEEGLHVDLHKIHLQDGDCVLLCTDGLNDAIEDNVIRQALLDYPDPDAACQRLLRLVLEGAGRDNVAMIVARYQVEA